MGNSGELVLLCGGTALINATYAAKHKHNVAGSVIASGVSFAALSFLAGVWRTDIALTIAGVLFFGALVVRGLPLISNVTDLPAAEGFSGGGGGSF